MNNPLPCPFCGSTNLGYSGEDNYLKYRGVYCVDCEAIGPEINTNYDKTDAWKEAANKEWNKRVVYSGPLDSLLLDIENGVNND
jgi:hypothetical protein